ncbi:acetyl-CoA carboxylase biotin carboxyl carrier protein [Parvularcula marina]|uniref:Biotin carboxyl carrier protein of acetyl-CoA carboxylase n=1 Tax=Parvularcula marina TaxID=2292771 RepID=A0A371RFW5_9PROT|nr:acetyl-CoA carboxylase biotin carboxyl carrier protein [Parvularcula marina]RFB04339.1 acetyl-CoA carboxylase biotin carboxyl carrier protein [Parvularcula marina]
MPDTNSLDDDLEAIRAMAEVLEETGLTEIELDRGGVRLRIAKTGTTVAMQAAAPMVAAPQPALAQGQESAGGAADLSGHPGAVTSPMVGTAYLAPAPTSPPFVSVGDQVSEGQTVLIVEAMKTMNEIKATKAGKITQILAKDAEPVEFGEVLLIIE